MIAAVASNGVIGKNQSLPWYLPEDLKHFKHITMNHGVIFGRKTYESIKIPLVGRKVYVLTNTNDYKVNGRNIYLINEDFIYNNLNSKEILFIAGGQSLYSQFAGLAREIYLTLIEKDFAGDARFPVGALKDFVRVSREKITEGDINYYFVKYIKPFYVPERWMPFSPDD